MKTIIKSMCIAGYAFIIFASCATALRPPVTRQWMKQRSDGYWVVTTIHNFGNMTETVFECKPDSVQLSKL